MPILWILSFRPSEYFLMRADTGTFAISGESQRRIMQDFTQLDHRRRGTAAIRHSVKTVAQLPKAELTPLISPLNCQPFRAGPKLHSHQSEPLRCPSLGRCRTRLEP